MRFEEEGLRALSELQDRQFLRQTQEKDVLRSVLEDFWPSIDVSIETWKLFPSQRANRFEFDFFVALGRIFVDLSVERFWWQQKARHVHFKRNQNSASKKTEKVNICDDLSLKWWMAINYINYQKVCFEAH